MGERELVQQKMQAKIDEWTAELSQLKAKAKGASADAQLEMRRKIDNLESRLSDGHKKLNESADASGSKWDSLKESVSKWWESDSSNEKDLAGSSR